MEPRNRTSDTRNGAFPKPNLRNGAFPCPVPYDFFHIYCIIYIRGKKATRRQARPKTHKKGGKKADGLEKPARLLRLTKQSSHTLANLHSDGGTQEGRTIGRSPGRLGEKGGGRKWSRLRDTCLRKLLASRPREPKVLTTKVTTLIRLPGGGF